jgi:DNA-binding NarL/FixJ family response regulator
VTDLPIRVVVADDHALVRSGLAIILNAEPDLEVVGDAADGPTAARMAASFAADVVLMDIEMPGGDGILGTQLVLQQRPSARVIVLTTFDLDDYVFGALRAGASAFLLKTAPPIEIAQAIRSVHSGDMLFAPTVTRRLVETYVQRAPSGRGDPGRVRELTDREREVLRAVARGLSNAEIGQELFMGEATVKTHVTRILTKLGLRDRVQAVVAAYESGFISPGSRERDHA